MNDEASEKPKIIVDEDWKSQVEAEREELKQKNKDEGGESAAEMSSAHDEPEQLPAASLSFLISTLATQAMAALGQLPDPVANKPIVRLRWAKLHVDTLAVLQEKTKGNLTVDEERMLEDVVHQMRMLYVAVQSDPAAAEAVGAENRDQRKDT